MFLDKLRINLTLKLTNNKYNYIQTKFLINTKLSKTKTYNSIVCRTFF